MERLILNVKKREKGELLEKGLIPGVFYGREEKSTPISLLEADFMKAWKEAGESSIISLSGAGKDIDAVIQDVQFHPVTDRVLHAARLKSQQLAVIIYLWSDLLEAARPCLRSACQAYFLI